MIVVMGRSRSGNNNAYGIVNLLRDENHAITSAGPLMAAAERGRAYEAALKKVQHWTAYPDIECIVVEGGSIDNCFKKANTAPRVSAGEGNLDA